MRPLRVVFMGSPGFAVPALRQVIASGADIACVYTQPPRPAGRGQAHQPTPVHTEALTLGLPVRHPESLKSPEDRAAFAGLGADLAVVVAYGLILPRAVLNAPKLGCINLHASLLPRWRGAAPIQRAIMAGDSETGVQVMRMETGLDTGPVYLSARTPIHPDDTAQTLHDRLATLGADLIPEALAGLAAGRLIATPQAEAGVTYASKLGPQDQVIDWTQPARAIDATIRGLSPVPAAHFGWSPAPGPGEEPIRIKALMSTLHTTTGQHGAPGEVLDDNLLIACGEGAIRLTRLQRPGRGPLSAADFQRGSHIAAGSLLR
jgi:methionyl-tRNA formyltransferase